MGTTMRFNKPEVRSIVYAICKANTVDFPAACSENRRATNNCFPAMRNDIINDNLVTTMLSHDGVIVYQFSRRRWEICMFLNNRERNAYFVFSEQNLLHIKWKKNRTWPHYLQSLLHIFHEGYESNVVQTSFLPPVSQFDEDTYAYDCEVILRDVLIDNREGWHIYVVGYKRTGNDVTSATLYFFASDFQVIDSKNLGEYIVPSYASANKPIAESSSASTEPEKAESLIKIKPRPAEGDIGIKIAEIKKVR